MKHILPLFVITCLLSCSKSGSKPDPTPPTPKPTVKIGPAYLVLAGGVVKCTGFDVDIKIYQDNQIDSIVLIDQTDPYYFSPILKPKTGTHKVVDNKHPYPSSDTYLLKIYLSDRTVMLTPTFTGE